MGSVLLPSPVLLRLRHLYKQGILVPFLGAGMSVDGCPLWKDFVVNLEREAKLTHISTQAQDSASELIQRAARVVRKLKNENYEDFANAVRGALCMPNARMTSTSDELAKIWWPLVVTTNYDDWFISAWNSYHVDGKPLARLSSLQICGRNRPDCERILNSLRAPDGPLLWVLQGFVGGQSGTKFDYHPSEAKLSELANELVIGHEEYRRVTHGAPGFRRAFAEVFRSRSFLFLGTSLSDPYFLNLFDEILELQGSLGHTHYALVKKGSVDTYSLRERLEIVPVEYDDHAELPELLLQLRKALNGSQPHESTWCYALEASPSLPVGGVSEDLCIVRGGLPCGGPGECLSISAGKDGELLLLSNYGQSRLTQCLRLGEPDLMSRLEEVSEHIFRVRDYPAFVVVARDLATDSDYRDARVIREAAAELLKEAAASGFESVNTMLLAAGRHRKFPPYVSLIQMVKAFAAYKRLNSESTLRLSIYVVDPSVLSLLSSGRLDVIELLGVEDTRFWVEVWRGPQDVRRCLEFTTDDLPLKCLLEKYDIPGQGWNVQVLPSPIEHQKVLSSLEIVAAASSSQKEWTVAGVGLLPGSTLRLLPQGRQFGLD